MTFKNWSCKLKKTMIKNDQKKCPLKNDKVEQVLHYYFLNNENHAEIGLTYICVYSKEKNLN